MGGWGVKSSVLQIDLSFSLLRKHFARRFLPYWSTQKCLTAGEGGCSCVQSKHTQFDAKQQHVRFGGSVGSCSHWECLRLTKGHGFPRRIRGWMVLLLFSTEPTSGKKTSKMSFFPPSFAPKLVGSNHERPSLKIGFG